MSDGDDDAFEKANNESKGNFAVATGTSDPGSPGETPAPQGIGTPPDTTAPQGTGTPPATTASQGTGTPQETSAPQGTGTLPPTPQLQGTGTAPTTPAPQGATAGSAPADATDASNRAAGPQPGAPAVDKFGDVVGFLDDKWGGASSKGRCTFAIKQAFTGFELTDGTTYQKGKDGSITGEDFIRNNGDKLGYTELASGTLDKGNAAGGPAGYTSQKGDLAVFAPSDGHDSGHIELFDGEQWRSDFKQGDFSVKNGGPLSQFSPGRDFAGAKFKIYRHTGKNGSSTKGASDKAKSSAGKANADKKKVETAKPVVAEVTNEDKPIAHKIGRFIATTLQTIDAHYPLGKGMVKSFVNEANTSMLKHGSKLTFINGLEIWLKETGIVDTTSAGHPDNQPGTSSSTYQATASAASASKNLTIEGQKAVREGDKTDQNKKNAKGVVKKAPVKKANVGKGKTKIELPTDANVKYLAAIIYGEAKSSSEVSNEQRAVGWTVRNRFEFAKSTDKEHAYFGDGKTYQSTIEAQNGGQYEAVIKDKYKSFLNGEVDDPDGAAAAITAAKEVIGAPPPARPGRPDPTRSDYMPYIDFLPQAHTNANSSSRGAEEQVGTQYFRPLSEPFYEERQPKKKTGRKP